jgi:ERCC4-type nuclease
MNASKEELLEVDGVGKKRAEEIHSVLTTAYTPKGMAAEADRSTS